MNNDTDIIALRQPESVNDPLTEIARDGARRMLAAALCAEADAFIALPRRRGPTGRSPARCPAWARAQAVDPDRDRRA